MKNKQLLKPTFHIRKRINSKWNAFIDFCKSDYSCVEGHDGKDDFPFIISTKNKSDFKIIFRPENSDDYLIIRISKILFNKFKKIGLKDYS